MQIDNELMFSRSAGASLWESPWVAYEDGNIKTSGLKHAVALCKRVMGLTDSLLRSASYIPKGYAPEMLWSIEEQIKAVRPRAAKFIRDAERRQ